MPHQIRPLLVAWLLVAAMTFSGEAGAVLRVPGPVLPSPAAPAADAPRWTVWGADQYALADDGVSVWIAGVGGVVRWDKQQGTYRRFSMPDGLPQTKVLAVAIDAAGNRWIGGDGGLSRLDPAENWTHLQTTNSGLYSNYVDGIAIVEGETLYASHGLPGGSVSRHDPDGFWHWFPNRETAIVADYAAIVQERGSNALWTVAGNEIWAGTSVFDGERWVERKPPGLAGGLLKLEVDSRDHVWTLSSSGAVDEWDGTSWSHHDVPVNFSGQVTALVIDQDDKVWVGMQERPGPTPYTNEYATVKELTGTRSCELGVPGPFAVLMSTSAGLWGAGPSWVMSPGCSLNLLTDVPRFHGLPDAMSAGDGSLWLYSGVMAPYPVGVIQVLDDRGTLGLEDDRWQPRSTLEYEVVTAPFERAGSDIWYTSLRDHRFISDQKAVRYRAGRRIEYPHPFDTFSYSGTGGDIYAQDEGHVWFAVRGYGSTATVLGLNDGGTAADLGDDVWQTMPVAAASGRLSVAVDASGVLWHGQASGLYRYDGAAWQQVYGERAVCDLAPAADGTLYVQVESSPGAACGIYSDRLVIVRPGGNVEGLGYPAYVKWVVRDEESRVRTASRRNSLWTVAPGGAIWYVSHLDPGHELQRRTPSGVDTYPLPMDTDSVQRLEVDGRDHVWIVTGSELWRIEGPRTNRFYLPVIAR